MIYKVNGYNTEQAYFVDQTTFEQNPNYTVGALVVGTQSDAENLLTQRQQEVLLQEAVRFSVCATFVNGNDTTWREVQESDPEDTVCQVFDTFTGQYTEVTNKTEAFALNEQKKQNFLTSCGLDAVVEIEELPSQTRAQSQTDIAPAEPIPVVKL